MAIAHDTTTTAVAYSATGTQTTSHAASASARAAVVLIHLSGINDEVSAVTYGGVAMTRLGYNTESTEAGGVYIYFLDGIAGGTQNVAMTTTAATAKRLSVSTVTVAAGKIAAVAGAGYATGTSASVANPSWNITGLTASEPVVAYEVIHSGLQTMTTTPQTTPAWTLITSQDLGSIGLGFARIANTPSGTTLTCGWIAATADDYVGASIALREASPPVPVSSFTASLSTANVGQTVTFTDTSTNTPTGWVWDFGAGATPATAATQGPHNVTYSTPGAKTVTLTASNAGGAGNQASTVVTIATPANISTLTDDFSGTLAKWPGSYQPAQVTISGGQAKVTVPGTATYHALWTNPTRYDARNGDFFCQVTLPSTGAGQRELSVELRIDASNYLQFYMTGYPGGVVTPVMRSGGVNTFAPQHTLTAATFWLKFSVTNSVVTYSHSADGTAWTQIGSPTPVTFDLSAVSAHCVAGAYGAGEGTFDLLIDNVNIAAVANVAKIWNGTSFKTGNKVWNGTSWRTDAKVWDGTKWLPIG